MKSSIKYIIPLVVFLLWSDVARAEHLKGLSVYVDFLIPMIIWFILSLIIVFIFSIAWSLRSKRIYGYLTLIGQLSLFMFFMRLVFLFLYKDNYDIHPNQSLAQKIKLTEISDNPNIGNITCFFVLAMICLILVIVSIRKIRQFPT